MIEIRKYQPEDFLTIKRRDFDALAFMHFPNPKAIASRLAKGPAFTMLNGNIIACAGVLPLWKGSGEGWAVTSPLVEKYPVTFAKSVFLKITEIIEEMQLIRLQTVVDAEHTVSQNWLKRMGFKDEGLMRKYLGGRDFYRYAWIREK